MRAKADEVGICADCRNAPTCTYHGARPRRVFQCDEFEPRPVRAERLPHGRRRTTRVVAVDPELIARRLGLCATCDFGETCTLAPTEGGVWQCAQYQ